VYRSKALFSEFSVKFTNNLVSEHSVTGPDRGAAWRRVRPPASGVQNPIRARQRRRGRPPGSTRPAQLLLPGPLRVRPEDPGGAGLQDRRHNIVKDRKRRPEEGWMRAVKFLAKYSAAVTNSPPNTRSNQRDVHDPNEWADVPYKHSRTLQNKRKRRNSNWITTAQTTDETNCCPEKYLKIVALKNYLPLQERSVLDTWERH
jgi:hypothetical protein